MRLATPSATAARPGVLSRRLATGFAAVSFVALAMCVVLEALLGTVENSVAEMQSGEATIREGLSLATAVREQYIHQAHMLIEQSEGHMDHYPEWVERVRSAWRLRSGHWSLASARMSSW